MNPFTILTPAEAWSGLVAVGFVVPLCWMIFYRHRPTEGEKRAYYFGYEDGDLGAEPIQFSIRKMHEAYTEGYRDGSAGRNRRADAELLRNRANRPAPQPPAKRH